MVANCALCDVAVNYCFDIDVIAFVEMVEDIIVKIDANLEMAIVDVVVSNSDSNTAVGIDALD